MKKITNWLKKNRMIIATEGFVLVITIVLVFLSYGRYFEAVCNIESLNEYYALPDKRKILGLKLTSLADDKEEAEELLNSIVFVSADEDYKDNKNRPYGIYYRIYGENDKLITQADNSEGYYDNACFEIAEDVYKTVEITRLTPNGVFRNGGIIPSRYYAHTWIQKRSHPAHGRDDVTDKCVKYTICIDVTRYIVENTDFVKEAVMVLVALQVFAICLILLLKKKRINKSELDKTKDLFVNAIAHEMKTPAAVIINSMECIQEGVRPEKIDKYRDNIFKESDHINKLIDSMMLYTDVTDAKYELLKEDVNLNAVAKSICDRFEILAEKRNIKITMVESGKLTVYGDKKLLSMVIDNYISNAVKHCREKGKIIVEVGDKELVVFNEGKQINIEDMPKIWDPLYKTDEARTESGDSSGMGLAICAEILKLHGFGYGVRNTEDGVVFSLNI